MKKNIYKVALPVLALLTPAVTFASGVTLSDVMTTVVRYFSSAILFIISLAVLTFIWNVYKYFFMETDKRKEAGLYVLYSTVGFFVMLSLWGLVALLMNTFKLDNAQPTVWPFNIGSGYTTPSNTVTGPAISNTATGQVITNTPNGQVITGPAVGN